MSSAGPKGLSLALHGASDQGMRRRRAYRRQGVQDAEPMSDHDGPQPVYAVRFDGTEVWGESAEPNSSVCLDMWEAYLVPA